MVIVRNLAVRDHRAPVVYVDEPFAGVDAHLADSHPPLHANVHVEGVAVVQQLERFLV